MKTTYVIIIVCVAMVLLTACTNLGFKYQTTAVSEIVDITDPLVAKPKPDNAVSLFDLNNNLWNGASFRLLYITNVSYNPMFEAKIEPENQWLGNKFQRKDKVKSFYATITTIASNTTTQVVGKDNSAVYFPIANELNSLSQSTATKKYLIVYSDLMENTSTLSFYNKASFNILKTKPEEIKRYFGSQMKLTNLSGITIYLIYQPVNTFDDENYRIVSGFYKALFESKGAVVEIMASVN
jgi:hemoglobin-like flavoprotein